MEPHLTNYIKITGVYSNEHSYYIEMIVDDYGRHILWSDTLELVRCGPSHKENTWRLHPLEIPYINKTNYLFNREVVIKPPEHRTIYLHNNTWTTEKPR